MIDTPQVTNYCLECVEQARLLGMSAEREAALLNQVRVLEKVLVNYVSLVKDLKSQVDKLSQDNVGLA